jgi:hypothetical protein
VRGSSRRAGGGVLGEGLPEQLYALPAVAHLLVIVRARASRMAAKHLLYLHMLDSVGF